LPIDKGKYSEADYTNSDNNFNAQGKNTPPNENGVIDVLVYSLSVIADYSPAAAKAMANENPNSTIDWFTNKPTKGDVNLLTNNPWNPKYENPQDQVTGTLLQELSEAVNPNQSESKSRKIETKFIEQNKSKKSDGN